MCLLLNLYVQDMWCHDAPQTPDDNSSQLTPFLYTNYKIYYTDSSESYILFTYIVHNTQTPQEIIH